MTRTKGDRQADVEETGVCMFPQLSKTEGDIAVYKETDPLEVPAASISEVLQGQGIHLSSLVLAAWAVTLRCFTECHKAQFWVGHRGEAVAETTLDGLADLLSIPLDPQKTMRTLCNEVEWTMLQPRLPGHAPCNIGLVFQNGVEIHCPTLRSDDHDLQISPPGCDVALHVDLNTDRLRLSLRFRDTLLSSTAAGNVVSTVQQAILEAIKSLDDPISNLMLCTRLHVGQLETFSRHASALNTRRTLPWWRALSQSVIQQGTNCDRLAIDGWDGRFTFEELEETCSRVAAHLQTLGIGPRMMIPLCFEKSVWAIVAAIGIHMAGAAFVPLDPAVPVHRLHKIIAAVGSEFAIVSPLQTRLVEGLSVTPIIINQSTAATFPPANTLTNPEVSMDDPAYCLFTSGSTGTPKGCIISHEALAGVSDHGETIHLSDQSRVLQFSSYSFGISIIEIYCTLGAGATVCVVADEDCSSLSSLARAINRMEVNWTFMTPTMIGSLHPKDVPCLQTIVTGGEPLQKRQVVTWANAVRLYQGFGLTEWSGTCCISPRITSPSSVGVIGRPVPNARVWLVEPTNHTLLAPVGAVAELCIEGPCLAQGYLNDAEKTSKAFVSHPGWHRNLFPPVSGGNGRLYRTGDLVRYMCDGTIKHLGRKDTQRKVRGQRVDLAEVEYHLKQCFPQAPRVFADVISPCGDGGQTHVLAAFVQSSNESVAVSNALAEGDDDWFIPVNAVLQKQVDAALEFLFTRLPRYMVPDLFLSLRKVPLTVTGKIDRRRLCTHASKLSRRQLLGKDQTDQPRRAPSTDIEALLASLVAKVLNTSPSEVGLDDNFFHLGGDSIKAMALVGEADLKHGLRITVGEILTHPTVAQLAAVAQNKSVSRGANPTVAPFSQLHEGENREDVIRAARDQCRVEGSMIEDIYPCTPLQEGMFALGRKQAGGYVARWVFELHKMSDADMERLKGALIRVFEQAPTLRSRIILSSSQRMYQVLLREMPRWHQSDILLDSGRQEERGSLLVDFGLPLAKMSVHRQSTTDCFQLALTMHHSVIDGWCFRKILDQVEAVYHGNALPASPPFSLFVNYLHQLPDHKGYWKNYLSGLNAEVFPAVLPVSYKPSPTAEAADWIDSVNFTPGRFTRSSVLRLAWAMVQSQYQGNYDIVYGVTVSGRNAPVPGILTMAGPTVATMPLRIQLDPAASIEDTLDRLVQQTVQSIPHEQTGLQNMRKWGGDIATACDFQTLLVIQQIDGSTGYSLLGTEAQESSFAAFCTYTLTLVCNLNSDPVELKAWFDPKLVPERQVQRMLRQLKHVVQAICRAPSSTVDDCMTPNAADIQEIHSWNQQIPALSDRSVNELICQGCVEHPSRLAVDAWDVQFTYQALNELSTNLAQHLVTIGVRTGDFVPICSEKSGWTIISMLAVMKSGAAFILLDPAVPKQRLVDSCQQAKSKLVLTTTVNLQLALELVTRVVVADDQYPSSGDISLPAVHPDWPLFAVFTSGSTGIPKAAMADHQSFLAYSCPIVERVGIDETVRWLQFSSYAFDMSVNETLWILLGGGCLCVPSESQRMNEFVDTVAKFQPTHAVLTPSLMRSLNPKELPSLRALMLGGEPTQPSEINAWSPYMELMIGYGPAECGVTHLRYFTDSPNDPYNSVGHTTGGASWLVAPGDPKRLVPIGAVGELLLEGPFVGPGYLHNAAKTEECFIPQPHYVKSLRRSPSRVYKTGDLMRYNVDGSLSFVGRIDSQVKIRGQRIELADVETHLLACFQSRVQLVVELISPRDSQAAPFLAAFIYTATEGNEETQLDAPETICSCGAFYKPERRFHERAAEVLAQLRDRVPRFMVPSIFINLVYMPQTSSGKVDRKYLRRALSELPDEELKQFRAGVETKRGAANELEKKIQRFCATALQIPPQDVGLEDNFFQLGGDSISAMYMVAEARKEGIYVSVADVLDNPRLSTLANKARPQNSSGSTYSSTSANIKPFALVDDVLRAEATRLLLDLRIVDREAHIADILPVTESQSVFLNQWTPVFLCYFLTGFVDGRKLRDACEAVVSTHSILRTAFIRTSQALVQVVLQDIDLPFHQTTTNEDLLTYCDSIWQGDCEISSTVNTAPLRFILASRSATEHAFIIRISHAQYDGISMPTLTNDLGQAYSGGKIESTIAFATYMHLRSSRDHAATFDFWRQYLLNSSIKPLKISPTAPTLSRVNACSRDRITTGENIPMPNPPTGITVATLVKAAAAWLLARAGDQDDIVLGQTVTGRSMPIVGVERMLGPCLNTIPFRVNLQPGWTVLDLLQHVQTQCARTFAYDYVDLGDIVRTSTKWSEDSYLPCVIQHQNVAQTSMLAIKDVECTSSGWAYFTPPAGIWVLSTPQDSKLQVMLCASGAVISLETAKSWVNKLCTIITTFASQPAMMLDSIHI
ncbi:non-ribosomal peptide synthase [Aspergillus udagawae]|nr:non-ribosomal peptide synthase [Aspergillus udagawae]